ncbi:hypothetical protein AVEN_228529-1 [Araneus ventricosus]|uniref:Uncharacterized protein n=1 Tax=Araneus ventricosus TaxID=182803 RepID=A0A4Y2D7U4_ARAVE|nr:hypothetical protein AVEN_228529-1 [Araneus ventricosus]
MIYPKNDMESTEVETKIKGAMNPAILKVGIRNVRNLKKGGIMIKCGNDEEISKLKEEIESNEALKYDLEFHRSVKKNPKIIIYRVEEDIDPDAALKLTKDQNEVLRESEE